MRSAQCAVCNIRLAPAGCTSCKNFVNCRVRKGLLGPECTVPSRRLGNVTGDMRPSSQQRNGPKPEDSNRSLPALGCEDKRRARTGSAGHIYPTLSHITPHHSIILDDLLSGCGTARPFPHLLGTRVISVRPSRPPSTSSSRRLSSVRPRAWGPGQKGGAGAEMGVGAGPGGAAYCRARMRRGTVCFDLRSQGACNACAPGVCWQQQTVPIVRPPSRNRHMPHTHVFTTRR